jgi:hypothetical protein
MRSLTQAFARVRRLGGRFLALTVLATSGLLVVGCKPKVPAAPGLAIVAPGLAYTNHQIPQEPWSIHVVRIDRHDPSLTVRAVHARNVAVGLAPLSAHLREAPRAWGSPVAAVNGDFYQRDRAFAGDTRGLQVTAGELISAPNGISFWLDAAGQAHLTNVLARFELKWPDGAQTPFGLNEERRPNTAVLYTPAIGFSTRTEGGREYVLEASAEGGLPTLVLDTTFKVRVKAVHDGGNAPLSPGTWVLSLGGTFAKRAPTLTVGAQVTLSTTTSAKLRDVATGIGGGPVLVRGRRPIQIEVPDDENYQTSSMLEQHPRSAVGWNHDHLFLVTVDGRQRGSIGMTLEELSTYLIQLGCDEAMNLDGGGSATLWCHGQTRNQPCDGRERPIANSLVILRKADSGK